MNDHRIDRQVEYWNRVGRTKTFGHPLNFDRLAQSLTVDSRILDYGCGYGRTLKLLQDNGYRNLIGADPSPMMVAAARELCPMIPIHEILDPPRVDLADSSVDAVLLLAVLTRVPSDEGQRTVIEEVGRLLRPGGFLYISDLWLQSDKRNVQRYERCRSTFEPYGVFRLPEGVTLRHHDPQWIASLLAGFEELAIDEITVQTMNGHYANGFQWFGSKPRP